MTLTSAAQRAHAAAPIVRLLVNQVTVKARLDEVTAVDGVSFAAADGQITGLLGENGAGKTTTLAMIGGVLKPDAGSVQIDGAELNAWPSGRPCRIC